MSFMANFCSLITPLLAFLTNDTVICAHHEDKPPVQTCHGDSGGPLILDDGGFGFIIGIVSFGANAGNCNFEQIWECIELMRGKCTKNNVDVFVNVQTYLPWIYKIIEQGSVNQPYNIF